MCDPISAIVGVSAGVGLFGQVKAGKAAKKQGADQQVSYEKAAKSRLDKVIYDVETAERAFIRQRGTNLAAIGQTGVSRTSFYDVLADNATEMRLETQAIKYTGEQEARQLRENGAIAYQSGKDQARASYINGASNLLGTLGGLKLGGAFETGWATTTYNSQGQII